MCTECGKTFFTRGQLKYHILKENRKEQHFKCDQCGKSFVEKNKFQKHQASHSGIPLYEYYTCQVCFERAQI